MLSRALIIAAGLLTIGAAPTTHKARSHKAASTASASPTAQEDGNAGLAALDRGDNDVAIVLFTRALEPGRLGPTEQGLALVSRARAYAAKGNLDLALSDLRAALAINPSDSQARSGLEDLEQRKRTAAFDAAMAPPPKGADPWGVFGEMAGRCYWYDHSPQNPHLAYAKVTWLVPRKTLGLEVRTKTNQFIVGEYARNEQDNVIIYSGFRGEQESYGTLWIGVRMAAQYGWSNGFAVRDIVQADGGEFTIREQVYDGMDWQDRDTVRLTPATTEDLRAANLISRKRTCP